MGAPRFDPSTGLPVGVAAKGVPESDRKKVARYRAEFKAAQAVWDRHKRLADGMRRMLAGKHLSVSVGGPGAMPVGERWEVESADVNDTNLFLRAQRLLKAEAAPELWEVQYPAMGDLPDEIVDDAGTFSERLAVSADAMREFADEIDDGGTIGVMATVASCHRVVSRKKQQGQVTPISDLVLAAAAGDPNVHPMPGMDYLALAQAATAFAEDPEQDKVRTLEQLDNLRRLAQEANEAWADEVEKNPDGYAYGEIKARRLCYGDDLFWDSRITTSWRDARRMWIRKLFTRDECRDMDEWKRSARYALRGTTDFTKSEGWQSMASAELDADANTEMNAYVSVIECWDRDEGTVHYFTEGGDYDGFLERDAKYPYMDPRGKPIFKHFFPVVACTPVVHNLRIPERTFGIGWLYPGRSAAKQYNLFGTALLQSRKKCGRIVEVPSDTPDDVVDQIKDGEDCAVIKRPPEVLDGKKLVEIHTYGESPVDLERGMQSALFEFAREVDISVEQISGTSLEKTVGQAQMAQAGSNSARGGLIRKLQTYAGEVVSNLVQLAIYLWTDEKATELMGPDFTKRIPAGMDPATGQPIMGADGKPAMLPSVWDLIKGSSTLGDQIQVSFAPAKQDFMRQKAEDDTLALLASPAGMNPLTPGFPYYDPRPMLKMMLKNRAGVRAKPFPVPPMAPPTDDGDGSDPENPSEDKGERQAPGGGRADGRQAHGMRGPGPVPGRQGRGEKPGDDGDQSVRAHRVSTQ